MGMIKRLLIEIQEDCLDCGGLGYTIQADPELGHVSVGCDTCSRKSQDLLANLAPREQLESGDIDWVELSMLDDHPSLEPDPWEPGWDWDEEEAPQFC